MDGLDGSDAARLRAARLCGPGWGLWYCGTGGRVAARCAMKKMLTGDGKRERKIEDATVAP